jgi:uncharacterized glyoxalase superfamily metalloenzyme YdcJ
VKLYPLVFSFRDLIPGNGFIAGVAMDGRALLVVEDDQDTWVHGVQPGGIAAGDSERRDVALTQFKKSYLSVLHDIAAETSSFQEFQANVTEFFNEISAPDQSDWHKAVAEVRRQQVSLADLPTVKAESKPPSLFIQQVATDKAKPNISEPDVYNEAA